MLRQLLPALTGLVLPCVSFACASCGCSLSSDWQDSGQSAFKLDLRYDFINQNQLRSNASTITAAAASQVLNSGNPQEVEQYTTNHYVTASVEYLQDPSWKLSLHVPYIVRSHSTLGTASDGYTAGAGGGQYQSNTSTFGDVKLIARYQGFTSERNWGAILGFKLPTGSHTLSGTSTDVTTPGPVAIDRGLQPGSGTLDVIVGAFYTIAIDKNWDTFGELLYQAALHYQDQYRPGNGLNLSLGARYVGFEFWTPQLQLNARNAQRDQGPSADAISTGGTLLYLSPGASISLGAGVETYGFIQIPVYQFLNGVQLAPVVTASLGVRYYL